MILGALKWLKVKDLTAIVVSSNNNSVINNVSYVLEHMRINKNWDIINIGSCVEFNREIFIVNGALKSKAKEREREDVLDEEN